MIVTLPMSCAICESEETTGRWHAKRAYAFLPVCEACRTNEHFTAKYAIMLERKSWLRKPDSHVLHAFTWCGHGISFDADCDGCATESGGTVFVDIDNPDQLILQRFEASETGTTFI